MTSGETLWCQPILVSALLIWAAVGNTIENCNFERTDFTGIDSPKTFQCQEDPVYSVTSQQAGLLGAVFRDEDQYNYWVFVANPPLNLEIAGKCPSEMKYVVCEYSALIIGSSFEAKDGTYLTFEGEQRFGEVYWICNATDKNGDTFDAIFIFFIDGTQNDTESDISPEGADFLKNLLWNANDPQYNNTDDLDMMKLQKFDKVTSDSEVIFAQGDDKDGHSRTVLFTSDDVAIKVSENMYNIMTTSGPPSNVQVTEKTPLGGFQCEHYYKLIFPGSGNSDASVAQLYAGPIMLMYFLWLFEF